MFAMTPVLTDSGKGLLVRAIAGEELIFTQFAIGNGEMPDGSEMENQTAMINQQAVFGIQEIEPMDGYVKITGKFDTDDLTGTFRWTEIGLFAKIDGDVSPALYAYANCGNNGGIIGSVDGMVAEQTITLVVAVSSAENVTAILAENAAYASKQDFEDHINNRNNPHGVTASLVGLGNVENAAPGDSHPAIDANVPQSSALVSGERLGTMLAKIAKAISTFTSHLTNYSNPHRITADLISAAKKEHKHDASDIASGVMPVARGGTGVATVPEIINMLGIPEILMYTGNDEAKRLIETAFRPKAAVIFYYGQTRSYSPSMDVLSNNWTLGIVTRDNPLYWIGVSNTENKVPWESWTTLAAIEDRGLFVGSRANDSGKEYVVIAIR